MPWPALLDCLPATEGAVQRGASAFIAENAFASGVQEAAGRTSTLGAIDGPGGLLRLGRGLEYGGNIKCSRIFLSATAHLQRWRLKADCGPWCESPLLMVHQEAAATGLCVSPIMLMKCLPTLLGNEILEEVRKCLLGIILVRHDHLDTPLLQH